LELRRSELKNREADYFFRASDESRLRNWTIHEIRIFQIRSLQINFESLGAVSQFPQLVEDGGRLAHNERESANGFCC